MRLDILSLQLYLADPNKPPIMDIPFVEIETGAHAGGEKYTLIINIP